MQILFNFTLIYYLIFKRTAMVSSKHAQIQEFFQRGPTLTFFSWWRECGSKIPLKADNHRPTSETPLNGVSQACRWWPNFKYWLGSFIFQKSGPILLKNPIIFLFFCSLSSEPITRFWLNLHSCIIGRALIISLSWRNFIHLLNIFRRRVMHKNHNSYMFIFQIIPLCNITKCNFMSALLVENC